jgi:hypothetical protein
VTWKLLKGKRETPCCHQRVRVVTIEPGRQHRRCDLCKATNVFVLEPMATLPGTLRLRWLTEVDTEEQTELLD